MTPDRSILFSFHAVSRRINRPPIWVEEILTDPHVFAAGRVFPLGGEGSLQLHGPFEVRGRSSPVTWQVRGRLLGRGPRLVRYARVEIEVTPWSDRACELRVRPVARRPMTWGGRRQERYFAAAHAASDHLLRLLTTAVPDRVAVTNAAPALRGDALQWLPSFGRP